MTDIWLVRTIDDRFRVKWRDEEGDVCEFQLDTEAEARAFGGSLLKFRSDVETMCLRGAQLKQHPELSQEEVEERVGFVTVRFEPRAKG
jgi:hypothetical protein